MAENNSAENNTADNNAAANSTADNSTAERSPVQADSAAHIDLSRVHLVGIGGAGMSGVARILLSREATVSGSDVKDSRPVRALRSMGAEIAIGHRAENLELAGSLPTVVVTSFAAIPQDNPELQAAADNGIPVIRRSDLLAELMDGYTQLLIAGTHGKTSTTSMAVTALQAAGTDPSFAIGGQLNRAGTNAHHGSGDVFVAEADESDASLLRYRPSIAVVTNIEPDHLDYFGTADNYFQVFRDFAELLSDDGVLVACLDDAHTAELAVACAQRGITVLGYGTSSDARPAEVEELLVAEITATEVLASGTRVWLKLRLPQGSGLAGANSGATTGEQTEQSREISVDYLVQIPGYHMVLNSVAAVLAGVAAGVDAEKLAEGVASFAGVRRRFEYHGEVADGRFAGVKVYDDYAHHPTEVMAVLTAAREQVLAEGKGGKVVACFQPHLYSRTKEFYREFAQALSLADACVVLDIFGARETPVEGLTSRIITNAMEESVAVRYEPDMSAAPATVASLAGPHDLVLTMGAGSVTVLAPEIVQYLRADGADDDSVAETNEAGR